METACSNIISWNPADVILFVLAVLVLIVFCGCIWAFFYAIFLFIFSKWDDAKVKSAWNSIRYMIIWIFLTVMLLFAGPFLLRSFWNKEAYSVSSLFNKMLNIWSCVITWISRVVTDYPNNNPFGDTWDPLGWSLQWLWWSSSSTSNDIIIYEL